MRTKKDDTLQVRIPTEQKREIEALAEARGLKTSEFVLEALTFYQGFHEGFLERMQETAAQTKLPVSTVIENLLMAYVGAEAANVRVFKNKSVTFQRAFQFDENGLITGSRVSELVYDQQLADSESLYDRLLRNSKSSDGRGVFLTKEQCALIAAGN